MVIFPGMPSDFPAFRAGGALSLRGEPRGSTGYGSAYGWGWEQVYEPAQGAVLSQSGSE